VGPPFNGRSRLTGFHHVTYKIRKKTKNMETESAEKKKRREEILGE
jgi:hypothetical protein